MRKLNNTEIDRNFLASQLCGDTFPMATISLGSFTSELGSSLVITNYIGRIYEIDLMSGYCKWFNDAGCEMPAVNINCITLH